MSTQHKNSVHFLATRILHLRWRWIGLIVLAALVPLVRLSVESLPGADFARAERLDEQARKPRPVDRSSPVYAIAQSLAGGWWQVFQCDGSPSVHAGGHRGYRILLRRELKATREVDGTTVPETRRCHCDYVLFPADEEGVEKLAKRIRWEKLDQRAQQGDAYEGPLISVYLGKGQGFAWYGHLAIPHQERLRKQFKLEGGDDPLELAKQFLESSKGKQHRSYALDFLARQGEAAIPILLDEIKHNRDGCAGSAIAALGDIPGEKALDLALSFYANPDFKWAVFSAVGHHPPNAKAKQIYLDMLREKTPYRDSEIPIKAVLQFQWKEAIPLLQAICEGQHSLGDHVACRHAIRQFQGAPVRCDFSQELRILAAPDQEHPSDPKCVEVAMRAILQSPDTEEAIFTALEAFLANGKANYEQAHENGLRLLTQLPRDQVLPVVAHLAARLPECESYEKQRLATIHQSLIAGAPGPERAERLARLFTDVDMGSAERGTVIEAITWIDGADVDALLLDMCRRPAAFKIDDEWMLGRLWQAPAKRGLTQLRPILEAYVADPAGADVGLTRRTESANLISAAQRALATLDNGPSRP